MSAWREIDNDSARRNNDFNRSTVNDSDRSAAEYYATTGVTRIKSRSGMAHEVHHLSDGLVFTIDGRIFRAGFTTQ